MGTPAPATPGESVEQLRARIAELEAQLASAKEEALRWEAAACGPCDQCGELGQVVRHVAWQARLDGHLAVAQDLERALAEVMA